MDRAKGPGLECTSVQAEVLTQSIGRPPKDWDFLQEAVRHLPLKLLLLLRKTPWPLKFRRRQFFLLWNNPENGADAGYGQRRSLGSP